MLKLIKQNASAIKALNRSAKKEFTTTRRGRQYNFFLYAGQMWPSATLSTLAIFSKSL